jgi:iron complex transport system substrate-binding protein
MIAAGSRRRMLSIGARVRVVAAALLVGALAPLATAAAPARIVSLNACTDELLMLLADPGQVAGVSPYSREVGRAWAATHARAVPQLSGEAEDVLMLKPDVVVAGGFTKRATRDFLKAKGLRVIEFDLARSFADVSAQLTLMGDIVGHPERAAAETARLDAALARAQAAASQRRWRVLPVSRRGWVSGDGLTGAVLAASGLANAASELGLARGGFATIEAIVKARPDFILVSSQSDFAEDQGRALLLHPALEALYPPEKRIVIPERLTVCGGPRLAEALERLTSELLRVAGGR